MKITFPILTVPSQERSDFLEKLQQLADSDFKEMIVMSPFVDSHIIKNLVGRCVFNDKRLLVITRYKQSLPNQCKMMDKAKKVISQFKDFTLTDRVRWQINERLHAKCVVCDWQQVLFGSQNLTQFGGLGNRGKGNFELGVYIEKIPEDYVAQLKEFIDEVLRTRNYTFYPES